jgi:hypothetical protein
VNSEIENLNDLLTDGDELLKVRIMIGVEEDQAVHQRHTDIKKRKFSSYIRKFKRDRLQSHI